MRPGSHSGPHTPTALPEIGSDLALHTRLRRAADKLDATGVHRYIECNPQTQITGGAMSGKLTDLQLLHELEPLVEKYLNRHLSMHKPWNPHDYIPWSDG